MIPFLTSTERNRILMDMLALARQGWPQAGPWEHCTWVECPGLKTHGEHVYAVIEDTTPRLHLHVHFDVENEVMTLLTIQEADNPKP